MLVFVFILSILCLLALDLGLVHRRIQHISYFEALAQSGFWIVIGLSFSIVIYFNYEFNWFEQVSAGNDMSGKQAVLQYLTAYLVEKSLSMENLFIMGLIFTSLKIPVHHQHRVLLWGILGAIILRGIMIFGGIELVNSFDWMIYLFGGIIILSAFKLLANQTKPDSIETNPLVGFLIRHIPLSKHTDNGELFTRIDGKWFITPLFTAMLLVESADLLFAIDSIPAVIAISRDPFIVYSSNIFAILGLRALYFVLASALQKLHYLKLGLVIILFYIGIKIMISHYHQIETMTSLIIISAILIISIAMSLRKKEHVDFIEASPLAGDLGKIYLVTYAGFKRILISLIGTSVIIVGIIMIFTPGPAIIVIPAGLAILATEFIWARVLLKKFKDKFIHYSKETRAYFTRTDNSHKNDK